MPATFNIETELWNNGYEYIVGVDEVGRGAWAGPVMAAAVIFPKHYSSKIPLDDSKKLTPKKRAQLVSPIQDEAVDFAYGSADNQFIDTNGIVAATQFAIRSALRNLSIQPDFHLVDAFLIRYISPEKQKAIIKGDSISASIAAASILAKEYRDAYMADLTKQPLYTPYAFHTHKGYGTKAHQTAIQQHGLSDLHRESFVPNKFYEKSD